MDGQSYFRYVAALTYSFGCLTCHGTPAGEVDETGYPKEGRALGDLAGAVSIFIPMRTYEQEATAALARSLVFFAVLTLLVVFVVRLALRRWVTRPLEEANVRLQEDNKARSDFLAVVSHELRTPLSSIVAFTDIWERKARARGDVDTEDARLVGEIRENSRALLDLVNNTIDVEKVEQNRFQLTYDEIDLVDVVDMVCDTVEPLAIKKGVELRRRLDSSVPILQSDWEALRKILTNLVGNAIKFTDAGGTVTVGARACKDDQSGSDTSRCDWVELFVQDTGIGIHEDDLVRVFGKFSQSVYRVASNSQGSGLGLYLVRTLAERLGGRVEVSSVVGKGSTFTVLLPVEAKISSPSGSDGQAEGEERA